MSVSSIQSGYQIIDQSARMAEEAAQEIQLQPQPPMAIPSSETDLEFNKVKFDPPEETSYSDTEPLIKLSQAQQYNKIGTNMLQRDQDMIGTLLDIHI
ncbi:hypothetical protein L4D20_05110 [Vibrio kyushuensis]|uniref:hypothetical protein n=1 Tax=Vibrio kyushuensis TaxID=2910249 RepID=UPI003D100C46